MKKGPFVDEKLYIKVQKQAEAGNHKPIKTWARACTIVPGTADRSWGWGGQQRTSLLAKIVIYFFFLLA